MIRSTIPTRLMLTVVICAVVTMFAGRSHAQPAPATLTDLQKQALAKVADGKTELDDGFYGLMENAAKWDFDILPAAPKLNVKAIQQSPNEYRGQLFEIEGEFVGLQPAFQVTRKGPWDGKLEQWAIQDPESKQLVMIYLVGPPAFPTNRTQVRTVGRFYRIWPNSEPSIEQKSFVVFIGRTAEVHYEGALPPLTRTQRIQVETAEDFTTEIQRPAFFQLLKNATTWPDEFSTQPPLITHTTPLIAAPDEYRGSVLRVEGILAARRPIKTTQAGPWGENVEQWIVRITEVEDDRDESVVVYLTHPPDGFIAGDRVRLVGRFYQIWRDTRSKLDGENVPFNIAVLVGRSATRLSTITRGTVASDDWSDSGSWVRAGVLALAIVGFGLFMFRRHMKRMQAGGPADIVEFRRQARIEQRQAREHASGNASGNGTDVKDVEDALPLPENPVDALGELERRGFADE